MTCDRVLELLSDYIDGELSSASVLGVQTHLRRCARCEGEHEALRRTVQLVALFGRQEVPIDCREAVMARLRDVPVPAPRASWGALAEILALRVPAMPSWARATALAAVAVVSVSAGSLLMQRSEEVRRPAPVVALAHSVALVQEDRARVRESSQLLQALGRDDGYILAADIVDWNR